MHTYTIGLVILLALALGIQPGARAQVAPPLRDYHRERGRQYLEHHLAQRLEDGLLDLEAMRQTLERYEALVAMPLDANSLTFDDLLALPLMTEYKAYQFVRLRTERGGRLSSPSQLKLIAGWSSADVDLYLPMLTFAPAPRRHLKLRDYWERGRSRASLIAVRPMRPPASEDYLGSALALGVQWHWQSADRLSVMLGAERDSYEPWRHEGHRGFDSYTGHIALKGTGVLRRLVIGDYRARWGEGLIIHQGGRTISPLLVGQGATAGLVPSGGTSPAGKSRGLAGELQLGAWRLSVITSYRLIDGYVGAKTMLATGISDVGLHRTARQWRGRHNIAERYAGAQLAYRPMPRLEVALSALVHDWDGTKLANAPGAAGVASLSPMAGHRHLSLSYRYAGDRGRWGLSGEVAQSSIGAWAGLQRLTYRGGRYGLVTLGMRYIASDYWSYYGHGYTHYQRPHNEAGLSLGVDLPDLLPRLSISLEGDCYRSLRPRWRQREISRGYWTRAQLRYRLGEVGARDYLGVQGYYRAEHGGKRLWRYHLSYTGVWGALACSPKVSLAWHSTPEGSSELAYSLGIRLDYTPRNSWLRLRASGAYYQVADWDDRLYLSEAKLHQWYSTTFAYGRGYRLSAVAEGRLLSRLSLGLQFVYHYRHAPHSSQVYTALQLRYH